MNTEQFYDFWDKFPTSNLEILPNNPDTFCENVENFCAKHEITQDYFLLEFMI